MPDGAASNTTAPSGVASNDVASNGTPPNDIRPRDREIARADPARVRARRGREAHRRFAPDAPPHPGWLSLAAQRHVRAIAVGDDGLRVWLATWGGVLCWTPADGRVVRHASDHGLLGNPVRCVAADRAGVAWAGQEAGLCSVAPGASAGWAAHPGLRGHAVLRLAARPEGGVWVASRDADGRGVLGSVASPNAAFMPLLRDELACTGVAALLADDGGVWAANAWGVFRCAPGGRATMWDLSLDANGKRDVQVQVHALAPRAGGGVWAGTNWGLYALDPVLPAPARVADVPAEPVRALAREAGSARLWVVTDGSLGALDDDGWHPVEHAAADAPAAWPAVVASAIVGGAPRTWVGGAAGVHEVGAGGLTEAFPPSPDDALGNAVWCLTDGPDGVWVGTARGLFLCRSDGRLHSTTDDGDDVPARWDVRALARTAADDRLWAGTWRGGLRVLHGDVYVPGAPSAAPVVAVTTDASGAAWFATPDAVYRARADGGGTSDGAGRPVPLPPGAGAVLALCHQQGAPYDGAGAPATVWIGTSVGLFGWQPALQLWTDPPNVLPGLRVNALALDPRDGRLWAGTGSGLYSQHAWRRHTDDTVRALAFAPAGDARVGVALWVGTACGLARWDAPGVGGRLADAPAARLTVANSGLAADEVTALTVRQAGDACELWVGSAAGVSRYQHRN